MGLQDSRSLEHRLQVILRSSADTGNVLLQAWLPTLAGQDKARVPCLKTRGCPFALQGSGESLSLYRFQSCKYRFPLTPGAKERDASSEAFLTQKALLIADWQRDTQTWEAHPRAADARSDKLQSSIFLPVFEACLSHGTTLHPAAVVEATSSSDAPCPVSIETVAEELCIRLEAAALTVVPPRPPANTAARHERPDVVDAPNGGRPTGTQCQLPSQIVRAPQAGASSQSQSDSGNRVEDPGRKPAAEDDMGSGQSEEGTAAVPGSSAAANEEAQAEGAENQGDGEQEDREGSEGPQTRRTRKGTRAHNSSAANPKEVSVENVRKQFQFGLKEAASRLGVCTTTLKRICRRNGIQRWPRRDLLRESKDDTQAAPMEADAAPVDSAPVADKPSSQSPAAAPVQASSPGKSAPPQPVQEEPVGLWDAPASFLAGPAELGFDAHTLSPSLPESPVCTSEPVQQSTFWDVPMPGRAARRHAEHLQRQLGELQGYARAFESQRAAAPAPRSDAFYHSPLGRVRPR
ncbi:hypothetical protein WJX73_007214 [Symbiochloris irregularis]|uniref:RWP-RK domain-containing protein n=1 Tax=Symbiochloris irregularis TaxID=706552 RepID=A0AAW1NL62_9CHLO